MLKCLSPPKRSYPKLLPWQAALLGIDPARHLHPTLKKLATVVVVVKEATAAELKRGAAAELTALLMPPPSATKAVSQALAPRARASPRSLLAPELTARSSNPRPTECRAHSPYAPCPTKNETAALQTSYKLQAGMLLTAL